MSPWLVLGNILSYFPAVNTAPFAVYQKRISSPTPFRFPMEACLFASSHYTFTHRKSYPTYILCFLFETPSKSPIFPFLKWSHLYFGNQHLIHAISVWISVLQLAFMLLLIYKAFQVHYENFEGIENEKSFARRTCTKGHIWYLNMIDALLHSSYSSSEPWCCIDKHTYLSL